MEVAQEQSVDSLASLEERITRAVQVINDLRNENGQLQQRLKAAQEELKTVQSTHDQFEAASTSLQKERDELALKAKRLAQEVEEMRGERKQVRTRIEKLLNQLDLLSAS